MAHFSCDYNEADLDEDPRGESGFQNFETNPDFDLEDLEKKQKMHLLPIAVTNVPICDNKCDNPALKACQLK